MPMPSAQALQQLQMFLVSDAVSEDCFDYVQTHGFLTGLAVGPNLPAEAVWMPEIFAVTPQYDDIEQQKSIESILRALLDGIQRELYAGAPIRLPCPLTLGDDHDAAPLRGWALGFMDAVSIDEENWFAPDEDEVGELILPIAIAAGIFDDDHLNQIYDDPHRLRNVLMQIPESISELYLLYRE